MITYDVLELKKMRNLTDWEPEPGIAQVRVEGFPSNSRFDCDVKVFRMQTIDCVHLRQVETNSILKKKKTICANSETQSKSGSADALKWELCRLPIQCQSQTESL